MRARGFTLIELVVALAILSLLVLMATPVVKLEMRRAKEAELRQDLRVLRTAIDAYKHAFDDGLIEKKVDVSGYPPTLAALVQGIPNAKDPKARPIYFLRRMPRDPFNTDPALAPIETWATRSYASPPDSPTEGDDVFDVYSRVDETGINGTPYKEW